MGNIITRVVEFVSDKSKLASGGWDDEFSKEKYAASGKYRVCGLENSVIVNVNTGERNRLSMKDSHAGSSNDAEFWLESKDGEKTIVYLDGIVGLLDSGKYRVVGAKWNYGDGGEKR